MDFPTASWVTEGPCYAKIGYFIQPFPTIYRLCARPSVELFPDNCILTKDIFQGDLCCLMLRCGLPDRVEPEAPMVVLDIKKSRNSQYEAIQWKLLKIELRIRISLPIFLLLGLVQVGLCANIYSG